MTEYCIYFNKLTNLYDFIEANDYSASIIQNKSPPINTTFEDIVSRVETLNKEGTNNNE